MRVENNCINCAKECYCKHARSNKAVVWKNCRQFKPTHAAIEAATEKRERERTKLYRW